MKVLVEMTEGYCGPHAVEVTGVEAQLVIYDPCRGCNPTRSNFQGLEDGETVHEAVVMDRPDLDFDSYRALICLALDTMFSRHAKNRRKILNEAAGYLANELLDISEEFEEGSVVTRHFGEYAIATYKEAG